MPRDRFQILGNHRYRGDPIKIGGRDFGPLPG